jgi:hypothetical protein
MVAAVYSPRPAVGAVIVRLNIAFPFFLRKLAKNGGE